MLLPLPNQDHTHWKLSKILLLMSGISATQSKDSLRILGRELWTATKFLINGFDLQMGRSSSYSDIAGLFFSLIGKIANQGKYPAVGFYAEEQGTQKEF